MKLRLFLLFSIGFIACSTGVFSQMVGKLCFLPGAYLEIGMQHNGSFGADTSWTPAGYYPYPSAPLASVYDQGHDGWTVGTPAFRGDYTYPGSPFEGWEVQANGGQAQAYQGFSPGYSTYPAGVTMTGGITSYSSTGGRLICNWAGTITSSGSTLNMTMETRVDTEGSAVVATVKFYNTSASAVPGVYYLRSCDPDNDEAHGGGAYFSTNNYIRHQNEDATHKVDAEAVGTYYPSDPTTLDLCTEDCRAVAFFYTDWYFASSVDLGTVWDRTVSSIGTTQYTLQDSLPGDYAMGLVYNIGTIAAGGAVISYAYVYDGVGGIDSAFPDPELLMNGDIIEPNSPIGSAPVMTDTFYTCPYPGVFEFPISVIYGSDKNWTWSSWTWAPSTGLAATTGVNNTININALSGPTTYTVTGTDSSAGLMENCQNRVLYITIMPCFHATNNGPCINDTLWLVGHGDSLGATYFWYGPNGYAAVTQTAFRTGLTWLDTGVYYSVKTVAGLHDTVNTDVTFKGIPIVNATSADGNSPVCSGPGNTLLLFANPDTAVGETFQWSGPNNFSSAIQNASLASPILFDGGLYKVVTTSANGCMDSNFIVVVIDSTPVIPTASSNSPICSAPRGILELTAGDVTIGVSYNWTGPNGFISALQNPIRIPVYQPDSGIYTVTASIPYDGGLVCSSKNTTDVTIDSTPQLPAMTSNSPVCSGFSLNLTGSSSIGGTYSWRGPNNFTSGLQNPVIAPVTIPANGVYSVTGTYFYPGIAFGCISDTATLTAVIDSTPVIPTAGSNSPGSPSICQGDTLKLISADATDSVTFSWVGPHGYATTIENPMILNVPPSATGTYTVTAILGMCSSTTTIPVNITPTPVITATSNSPVCSGTADTLFLQATSNPGATFVWSGPYVLSSTSQSLYRSPVIMEYGGVYQVIAWYNGCASLPYNDTVIIRQTPNPPVVPWLTYCRTYAAPPLQAMGDSILYYPTNVAANGTLTAPVPPTNSDTVMWFYMTQTVQSCMSALDSMKITVNPKPIVTVSADVSLCPHDTTLLTAVDTDAVAYYHWFPSLYLDDTSKPSVVSRPENDMNYTVVASNEYSCTDTAHVSVHVFAGAVLYLGDSVTLYPGQTYQINSETNCTSFAWSPSAGLSNAFISNPVASPEVSTKYVVRGQTGWGCTAEDSISIYISSSTLLALPNAFTPGGGPNSVFKIIKQGIATLQYFRIFDRWGVKVFETTDMETGWDGSYKGVPQPLGVYVYEISALTSSGQEFVKQGNLTLIR